MDRCPSGPSSRRVERLRAQLRQVEAACVPLRRRNSKALSATTALEEQLEDAGVAIAGFQVDCGRERARHSELEAVLLRLQEEHEALEKEAWDVKEHSQRLCNDVESVAMREPELRASVNFLRGEFVDAGLEEGVGQQGEELIRLGAAVNAAEASCAMLDAQEKKLCREEVQLETCYRELETALQGSLQDEKRPWRYSESQADNDRGDRSYSHHLQELLVEAQQLYERAVDLEIAACEGLTDAQAFQ